MERSSFILSTAAIAACATAACSTTSDAIGLVEKPGEFDLSAFTKMIAGPAEVRTVFDGGAELHPTILGGVKNALNGWEFGFGVKPTAFKTVFVAHGTSNLLLYDDTAWQTYSLGQMFDVRDPSGAVVQSNIFSPARATQTSSDPSDVRGFYQDASIETLQKRQVTFFVCNTALVQQASQIANAMAGRGVQRDEVIGTLRKHLVPGAMLVPSGVATIAYLQSKYHYAYAAN
jgi:intracellular sulfur oxidation DsrE/DsrF family protein